MTLISYKYIQQLEGVKEEYYIVLFTSTLGAALLAVANHFVLFFLGLETLSISLYILIAFQRSKSNSIEAGIKYLILASVSSAFLLFGMALIYTAFGTMQFTAIVTALGREVSCLPLVDTGFGMMMVGIGFKLALVPFHMWTPDVYQGAPAPVSAFVATVSKGAVMAVLIRFFFNLKGFENHYLYMAISAIAILSMFVGNILAIKQKNIKRLLGYSSIANMGYLIIILLTGTSKGIQASIFYLISYFITTIGAFGIISLLSTKEYEAEKIEDYKRLILAKTRYSSSIYPGIIISGRHSAYFRVYRKVLCYTRGDECRSFHTCCIVDNKQRYRFILLPQNNHHAFLTQPGDFKFTSIILNRTDYSFYIGNGNLSTGSLSWLAD